MIRDKNKVKIVKKIITVPSKGNVSSAKRQVERGMIAVFKLKALNESIKI